VVPFRRQRDVPVGISGSLRGAGKTGGSDSAQSLSQHAQKAPTPVQSEQGSMAKTMSEVFVETLIALPPGAKPRHLASWLTHLGRQVTRCSPFAAPKMKPTYLGGSPCNKAEALQLIEEFFNAFNYPQFNNQDRTLNTARPGLITSTSVSPRLVQFALSDLS